MEIFIICFFIGFGLMILPKYIRFRGSQYKAASGNSFINVLFDKGNYGEFLTFSYLEKLNGHHKLMTNLYIPKRDGSTTEVDLIMISETGIYVFESKNYSGWIFGDEKYKNWTQTFQNKQKNRFFNPIWQNKGHVNALKSILEMDSDNLFESYIIFSERCTLKKINVASPNVKVIKRNALMKTIKKDIMNKPSLLGTEEIDQLYLRLKEYTRVDETVRKAHVDNIRMKRL